MKTKNAKNGTSILLVVSISLLLPATGESGWKRFNRSEPVPDQPVVADTVTGLVWQGCMAGKSGHDCSYGGQPISMEWDGAVAYCSDLDWGGDSSNWRLPAVKELLSIVDTRRNGPAIDRAVFPNTQSEHFWSHTESGSNAWGVYFSDGTASKRSKSTSYVVRCVRTGP